MPYDLLEYDLWIEYHFMGNNDEVFKTKVIPAKSNKKPHFGYNQQHTIEKVTKKQIEMLLKDNIVLKLKGRQSSDFDHEELM